MTTDQPPPSPANPNQVEVDWLDWHLRAAGLLPEATVESLHCEPVGASVGFLSRMASIVPHYSGPVPGVLKSMILKLETDRPNFREHYQLRIGSVGATLIERVLERDDLPDAAITARPRTLVHGDLRADNLLLDEPGSEDEVLILDWKTATRSLGAIDVAMLIGGSEPPPERAGHYQELFDSWLVTL